MDFAALPTIALDTPAIALDDLAQPWDDEPDVTGSEVDKLRRLNGDRSYFRTPTNRTFQDFRTNPDAYKHLERLPMPGESLHGWISGKYALAELVPALIKRTGQKIAHLYVATLSFSKQNATDFLEMFDAGQIHKITLVISHYFKSTSRPIYDLLIPQLIERQQRVLAYRNHAKLLLAEMEDATKYVVESSANLRSSVNTETFVLTNCLAALYDFHAAIIDEIIGPPA